MVSAFRRGVGKHGFLGFHYFPMAYTLFTAAMIFGVILVIAETTGATGVPAGLYFALEIWIGYTWVTLLLDYVNETVVGWLSVWAFFDVFVSMTLGFAGVWHAIFLLDNTQFALPFGAIPSSAFRQYIGFQFAAFGLLATVGFGSYIPRGTFAELWASLGVMQSIWWLAMLLGGGIRDRLIAERQAVAELGGANQK